MLCDFLRNNQTEILALAEEKTKKLAGFREGSEKLDLGLPAFYRQLIKVLEQKLEDHPSDEMLESAATHGREFLLLGYSLSHVVHSYGSMCQSITELATMKNANISAQEFNVLNGCLDLAIASAVSEFQFRSNEANEEREIQHLGFLAHELRNALSSATIAQEMIMAGLVGVGGSTANVLVANLARMRNLIDRSLSEVRMRSDSDPYVEKFRVSDLLDQIVMTAQVDANKRNQKLHQEVSWGIEVETDRQFLLSAVANLIQNAIKYSKNGGQIWLRGKLSGEKVVIEIQDECGGIKVEKIHSLFEPYIKEDSDKSGLGLGLSITKRAIQLIQGSIKVENHPGSGCTFIVEIPQKFSPARSNKTSVPGKESVQPGFGVNPKRK